MVRGGSASDTRFAIAVRNASRMQDDGSVPRTEGKDGSDETMVPRALT